MKSKKTPIAKKRRSSPVAKKRKNPADVTEQDLQSTTNKKTMKNARSFAVSQTNKASEDKTKPSTLLKIFLVNRPPEGKAVTLTKTYSKRDPSSKVGKMYTRTEKHKTGETIPRDPSDYKEALLVVMAYAKSHGSISQSQYDVFSRNISNPNLDVVTAADEACKLLGLPPESEQSSSYANVDATTIQTYTDLDAINNGSSSNNEGMNTTSKALLGLLGVGVLGVGIFAYMKMRKN